jgi:hypothetical protein
MTDPAPEPQEPSDPQRGQLPQHPAHPEPTQPAPNPRPIRASRVWAGIGLAALGHLVAICASFGVNAAISSTGGFAVVLPVAELLVFAACVGGGIAALARGDRGLGVGLLVGWAVSAVVFAGVCVALILVVANSLGR